MNTASRIKRHSRRLRPAAILTSVVALLSCASTPPAIYSSESDVPSDPVLQEYDDASTVTDSPTTEMTFRQADLGNIQRRFEDRGLVLTLDDLLFKTNSAELRANQAEKLTRLVSFLEKHRGFDVIIEGHTDTSGSKDHNMALSKARAFAVYEQLVSAGIAKKRLAVIALGDRHPIASNDTAEGRQQNRRVEIVISGAAKAQ